MRQQLQQHLVSIADIVLDSYSLNLLKIHFDDGDVEDNVEWGRIEILTEDSAEVQEYVENISEAEFELIEAFKVFDKDNTGTISAKEYFEILTEMGENPISAEEVTKEFQELGITWDSEIDYRELAKYMVSSDEENQVRQKILGPFMLER